MITLKINQPSPSVLSIQDTTAYGNDGFPLVSELVYWTITVWKGNKPFSITKPDLLKPTTISSVDLGMGKVFPAGGLEISVQVFGRSDFPRTIANYFARFPLAKDERVFIQKNGIYEDFTALGTRHTDGDWEWNVQQTMDRYGRVEIRIAGYVERTEELIVDEDVTTFPLPSLEPIVLLGGSARLVLVAAEREKWAALVGKYTKVVLEKGRLEGRAPYGTTYPEADAAGMLAYIGQRLDWLERWNDGDTRLAEDALKTVQTDLNYVARTKLLG